MSVLDRRPVLVDLWTSVPSYELVINGLPRTVLSTNKMEDIKIFLDFSIPIINSTEQILKALHANSGTLILVHDKIQGSRRFAFEVSIEFRLFQSNGILQTIDYIFLMLSNELWPSAAYFSYCRSRTYQV